MMKFFASFLLVFAAWAVLTLPLDVQECIVGIVVSLFVAGFSRSYFFRRGARKVFNPLRWAGFLIYVCVFVWMEIVSHLDVVCRIITGRINPAIVRVPAAEKDDVGKTLLSNSITLTPGTLTVCTNRDIFVHWIGFAEGKKVGRLFEKTGRFLTG